MHGFGALHRSSLPVFGGMSLHAACSLVPVQFFSSPSTISASNCVLLVHENGFAVLWKWVFLLLFFLRAGCPPPPQIATCLSQLVSGWNTSGPVLLTWLVPSIWESRPQDGVGLLTHHHHKQESVTIMNQHSCTLRPQQEHAAQFGKICTIGRHVSMQKIEAVVSKL